jgi:hypothetical protein
MSETDIFERTWSDEEVQPFVTDYGQTLRALDELGVPSACVDALENKSKVENKSMSSTVQETLLHGLLAA